MSFAAFGILILAAGFLAVSRLIITKSITTRSEGHPQYFFAAVAALVISLEAACIISCFHGHDGNGSILARLNGIFSPYLGMNWGSREALGPLIQEKMLHIVVLSIALAIIWPCLLNLPLRHNSMFALFLLERSGSVTPLELVIQRATQRYLPLIVTQNDGKFYIGYIFDFNTGEHHDWFAISPIFSGYRKDSKTIEITTDYLWTWDLDMDMDDATDGILFEDFKIALPLNSVMSIHPFNIAAYEERFREKPVIIYDAEEHKDDEEVNEPSKIKKTPFLDVSICLYIQLILYFVYAFGGAFVALAYAVFGARFAVGVFLISLISLISISSFFIKPRYACL